MSSDKQVKSTFSEYTLIKKNIEALRASAGVQFFIESTIIVNQNNAAEILGGSIFSDKKYFVDGVVNIGSIEIQVP